MEKEIIRKLRNKDSRSLDYIINIYSKKVYFLVSKIIGFYGKEEIEECMSDVFLNIWNSIDDFNEERSSFSNFVLMKAKYTALDYKRKIERKEQKIKELELKDEVVYNTYNIENIVLDKESNQDIINIINSFKEPDKTYFYLRYFLYYKIDDISKKYDVTRSVVENRLYRCRLQLKEILERRENNEG